MKKNTALMWLAVPTVAALALVGCGESKKEQASEDDIVVVEPVVQDIAVMCDDAGLKNRLVDALNVALLDESLLLTRDYGADDAEALEQLVRQKIAGLDITVQNVQNASGQCNADVSFTLGMNDVTFANAAFEAQGLPMLDEQAAEARAALVGNQRIVANRLAYDIEGNKAVLDDDSVVGLLANTIVTAAAAMAEDVQGATASPRLAVEEPIAAPRIEPRQAPGPRVVPRDTSVSATDTPAPRSRAQEPNRASEKPKPATQPATRKPVQSQSARTEPSRSGPAATQATGPAASTPAPVRGPAASEPARGPASEAVAPARGPAASAAQDSPPGPAASAPARGPAAEQPMGPAAGRHDDAGITIIESDDTY
ncbi:hypothetical protein B0181_01075 [Moraxella caviae]|uniref:Lipoprotein n=1 Tax=Moraxella caviae TaxID=34060 RepID=A0A1T0AB99_9GAMM|nr:hypothetical protein [Moraxella caviae]OOR92960.1 hypothetical protein B0181_01075 [Moraxella caviae]STZ10090.1 Uncharacterised protein [Moraxella caviae]VEW12737.1 Uncharacterised protein [Moraxella caviae]